jgi:hypothetical protein
MLKEQRGSVCRRYCAVHMHGDVIKQIPVGDTVGSGMAVGNIDGFNDGVNDGFAADKYTRRCYVITWTVRQMIPSSHVTDKSHVYV